MQTPEPMSEQNNIANGIMIERSNENSVTLQ